ncbi:MAG: DNA mismatch repair protein MutS [Deltaproteobacteria bacterium]|nr:DNA mismatch repair protein MutS [Deltaproteobacteria bacterium]
MASAFNNPFQDLKKTVKIPEKPLVQAKPAPPPPLPQEPAESEEEFFARQMLNVTPLKTDGRVRVTPPLPNIPLRAQAEENEALAELSDLVAGRTDFDITDTDEYLEGTISGLDIRLVRKLRGGDFSRQAALDLHGMTSDVAHLEVENFILGAVRMGLRCVLIVHGRGRNSPGQIPVLKDRLRQWLTRAKIGRMVLAFATARPHDGGPGAMYVLLRRERGRKLPLIVLEGAKR